MERKIRFNHRVRFSICAITLLSLVVTSCKSPATEADPAFAQYIESYTSGTISRHSPIRIMLAPGDSPVQEEGAAMPSSLFRFKPEIKGSRSEEHTSELQSLMRISYAVFCLKKKNKH